MLTESYKLFIEMQKRWDRKEEDFMVKQERRSRKNRRSDMNRRKLSDSSYKGPERRNMQDRRLGKDRRNLS